MEPIYSPRVLHLYRLPVGIEVRRGFGRSAAAAFLAPYDNIFR